MAYVSFPRPDFLASFPATWYFHPGPEFFLNFLRALGCPVQVLKWYLACTKVLRGSVNQLFISTTRPLLQTLCLVVFNSQLAQHRRASWPMPMTPGQRSRHWAYFKWVPLMDILQADAWEDPLDLPCMLSARCPPVRRSQPQAPTLLQGPPHRWVVPIGRLVLESTRRD